MASVAVAGHAPGTTRAPWYDNSTFSDPSLIAYFAVHLTHMDLKTTALFLPVSLRFGLLLIILSGIARLPSTAQHHGGDALPHDFMDSIALFPKALGDVEWKIASENELVLAYFNQGVQLKYAFAVDEAARSFRQARLIDPECAMCYWGEAWAMGAYLNGGMSKAKGPLAYDAMQQALALMEHNTSPLERSLINASAVRFVADYDPEQRREQDSLYALALKPVYERYKHDKNMATVYAEALFLLEPRSGTREMDDPNVMRLHQVLEGVLDVDIKHPGACHLYIHATESTSRPDLGEACAAYLGDAIPGASHINHMPSHTYNEVGRWGESVRANIKAWHSDLKAEIGEGIAIYPSHNLHMLLYAASFDGQGAIAIQAGKDFHKSTGNSMYHVLTLLRFGRFDEVLDVTDRPEEVIPGALWDFAQGYAQLRNNEPEFAKAYLSRVKTNADTATSKFRRHPAHLLLGITAHILEGELHRAEGNIKAAIESLTQAVALEDSMEYDEPEPLPFDARHWLGALLLEDGQYAAAEQVYRTELADHPNNGWSHFGLVAALEAQGKPAVAVRKQLAASWARADHWIRASRY